MDQSVFSDYLMAVGSGQTACEYIDFTETNADIGKVSRHDFRWFTCKVHTGQLKACFLRLLFRWQYRTYSGIYDRIKREIRKIYEPL